ncbi:MAG: BMC domain-containing protein [Ignavibacterium sp.]|jgi:ethanolamine utilization protein EutM|nr:BMC domain-containing protein [Ignavibacterium sp.]
MVFESLGTFETNSVSASLVALESIQKEKSINLLGKQVLGEGIVTLFISGDLGAIKRALALGAEAIMPTNEFRSSHVIPLPHKDLLSTIGLKRE